MYESILDTYIIEIIKIITENKDLNSCVLLIKSITLH